MDLPLHTGGLYHASRRSNGGLAACATSKAAFASKTLLPANGDKFSAIDVYSALGNNMNREKTIRFIQSGYDMEVLEDEHDEAAYNG